MESGLDRRAAWYGGGVARDDGIVCAYRCCCTLCGSKQPADGSVSRTGLLCPFVAWRVAETGAWRWSAPTTITRRCARSAQRSIEEWQAARSGQALAWRAQRFIARRSCRVLTTPARARCTRLPPLASPHALAGLTLAAAKPTRRSATPPAWPGSLVSFVALYCPSPHSLPPAPHPPPPYLHARAIHYAHHSRAVLYLYPLPAARSLAPWFAIARPAYAPPIAFQPPNLEFSHPRPARQSPKLTSPPEYC